jgi:hypothetical protein
LNTDSNNPPCASCEELTLRDYFATAAMQAQCTTDMVPGQAADALYAAAHKARQNPVYRLALNSYEVADAMILARQAKQNTARGAAEPDPTDRPSIPAAGIPPEDC